MLRRADEALVNLKLKGQRQVVVVQPVSVRLYYLFFRRGF